MEAMSPKQDTVSQSRSSSLTGEPRISAQADSNKMKSLAQRRQSAPSLVLSKALKSRTINKESCFSPVSPETCPLVQAFLCSTRLFVAYSHVQLKTGLQTQDRHLFLFTDIMIIAKSKSPSNFKLKHHMRVSEMWMASCMEEVCEGSTCPERSFVIGWPVTNCVATFSTPEEKEKWLALLQRHIKEEKEGDRMKTIPLKIITKDLGNCAYSKVLTISNEDTVNDIIKMALLQFGAEGSDADYRLWVTSGKDEAPYPLIGHEYPFGIKMSHVRGTLPQIQGLKDMDCPLDLQGPFLMEHLPREMQCQFILKPCRLAPCHPLADLSQKPFKRKRSIINWTFWRGSNSQLDNIPTSPTSFAPGMLFGLSLVNICPNDNIPKPVMDMLSVLCQNGPFTRGIFRRSANVKSCREMKERLDSGCEVNVERESILVTASVFKDFLRNIPGSIFSSKLYEKWVSSLDYESQEDKIKAIKMLIETLPSINILLLRYVFGVLYCIQQRSESNQMSAFNLAVCIAPSLLWPPTPSSPEIESEFTRKVALFVQFMIENCRMIFKEDISLLYASLSTKDESRDENSDICSFKLTDSSYDSLENELNDDVDSPFSGLAKKCSPDNRSRDSVLTLSDCDLDHPDAEDAPTKHLLESQPFRVAIAFPHSSVSREQSENESLCSNTSGYSSATVSDALKDGRRDRRCSEPAIGILVSRFMKLNESPHEGATYKTSCDALLSNSGDDYLKQHRDLQVEGQKLINRSLILGIDVSKSLSKKQTPEKKSTPNRLLPPPSMRLNTCSQTSCSSLSSPGTSPSGSSLSSLDSAFSQFSDYSALTPNEVPSPLECTFRSCKKQGNITPDFLSSGSFSGFTLDEDIKQTYSDSGKDTDLAQHKTPAGIHPGTWLKNGTSTVKNWSLRRREKANKLDVKNKADVTINSERLQPDTSKISERPVLQEQIMVPKDDLETQHLLAVQKSEDIVKDTNVSVSLFCEGSSGRRSASRHVLRHNVIIDKNGNGEHQVECSSFLMPSPVSINMEISALSPHTCCFAQESTLIPQSYRQKTSNSSNAEQALLLNHNQKGPAERVTHISGEELSSVKEESTKSTIGSFRVASLKRNKVLPSNIDTGFKMVNCDLEKNFCVSPKSTTTTASFAFQLDSQKHIRSSHESGRSSRECQAKRCSDPKFEDIDQRFFTEESYV
ncbi:rho GTPase-activating protein 20 isoform X2 [Xenopus laevis]|uniref:Rho GTPase-activating protein 20 n=2 Tax=Xenopus laevis TaxID=8355 RepID=A0A8J1MFK8_XENLA|nr:rho GTPase-activating protein 20 isoform X2 [Xenopus laevis]